MSHNEVDADFEIMTGVMQDAVRKDVQETEEYRDRFGEMIQMLFKAGEAETTYEV